jgi:hypothetical protein
MPQSSPEETRSRRLDLVHLAAAMLSLIVAAGMITNAVIEVRL